MEDNGIEFDVADFGPSEEVEVEPRGHEAQEVPDYSEGYQAENGESYSAEEMQFWNDIVGQANEMVNNGEDQSYVEDLLNGCFRDYIQKRDLQEFIDSEKHFSKDDISNEAWQMYENNLGKKTIKQCIEATDPFVKGFNSDVKVKATRTSKRHVDPFMSGFMGL